MLRRILSRESSALDLAKGTLRHVVFYFVYFFTLLIWFGLIGVDAQGNHGVVINNKKFDDSSGTHYAHQSQQNIETTSTKFVSSVTTKASIATTTNRPSTTGNLLVTIKDFQPQTYKKFNYHVQSTNVPVENPQTVKQLKRPQRLQNFLGIQHILKRNSSDEAKLDQLIHNLNKTGSLSRVNVFNTSRNAIPQYDIAQRTPNIAIGHDNRDHAKDSKELKVQFVLDCGLKDMGSTLTKPLSTPSLASVKKVPISYPMYPSYAFNQRLTTKTPYKYTQKAVVYYVPTKKPMQVTSAKPRIKNVYVDPPLVGEISDTMENVYNYFENALTTKVKVKPQTKNAKKRPIKRSTVENRITAPTVAPFYRYTNRYGEQNGQKLTTNIQVTSEYVGKDPATERPIKKPLDSDESDASASYSDEYESEYDDDDDDDDDDNRDDDEDDYYDFSLGGGDSGDDDDEDDSYDEDVKPPPNKIDVYRSNKKRKNAKRKKADSDSESGSDESVLGGFSMTNMGKYFQKTYDTITDYAPALPSIFGSNDDEDNDNDEDDDDDDDSVKRKPKLKQSLYSKSRYPNRVEAQEKNNRWYDKFFLGSEETEETTTSTTTPKPKIKSTTESGFFSWFGGSSEVNSEKPAGTTEQSWFPNFGLFSSGATTTTVKPESVEVTTKKPSSTIDANKWIEMLGSHLATMQSPSSTASTMNRTHVLKRVKYDDYQIWRIVPSTQAQLEFLREYKESDESENVMWLKGPSMRGSSDILVPPEMNKEVQEMLEYESIPFEVVVWDLEKAIKFENPIMSRRQKIELEKEQGHPMTWYRYHNFEDIAIYLDYLQMTYPDIVELIHIGRSFEGRPLMVAKVSFDATQEEIMAQPKRNKATIKTRRKKKVVRPGVFIEAGVHGREWISPAVATWILKELIKYNNTQDGNTEKEILRSVDWYIMPVSNPDGYEYSLNYDRMWHKTRSKLPETGSMLNLALKWLKRDPTAEAPVCFGTDPDRNYNIDWGKYSSSSACSEVYAGPKALSEPETKALASFLDDNKKAISLFVSLHSYGQFITYPSTTNSTFDASQRSNDLRDVAEVAVNALRDLASSGRYTVDNTNEMTSLKSGSSTDYAMHKVGIKYSYTIELRDTGTQGFLLSPSYIDTTGLETYEMIKAMVDYI